MKTIFSISPTIFLIGLLTSLGIMIIVDYFMGAEAEHLNAWVIVNRLFGISNGIPDSLAIKSFGLYGAAFAMLTVNAVTGSVLIILIKSIINLFH